MPVSAEILAEVARVLPAEGGITPKQAHARLGRWSLITVRHALRELVSAGRATFDGADCQRRYRRSAP